MSPKRPPTAADERDMYPRKTPPMGHPAAALAIPVEVPDDITGTYSGEERQRMRERRETPDRVRHLETRVDGVVADIGEIKGDIGELRGDVHGIRDMLERDLEERRAAREAQQRAETNQVVLQKTKITTNGRIVVALIGVVTAAISVLGTLAATGKL